MKTHINRETCVGCGACYSICPEVYDCDEDGIAFCHIDDNSNTKIISTELQQSVLDCSEVCPTGSVIVEK